MVDQIDRTRGEHWFAAVYLVTRFTGDPAIARPDKHGGLGWFALDATPDALTRPTIVALRVLRERRSNTVGFLRALQSAATRPTAPPPRTAVSYRVVFTAGQRG